MLGLVYAVAKRLSFHALAHYGSGNRAYPSRLEPTSDFWFSGGDSLAAAAIANSLHIDPSVLAMHSTARTLAQHLAAAAASEKLPGRSTPHVAPTAAPTTTDAAASGRPAHPVTATAAGLSMLLQREGPPCTALVDGAAVQVPGLVSKATPLLSSPRPPPPPPPPLALPQVPGSARAGEADEQRAAPFLRGCGGDGNAGSAYCQLWLLQHGEARELHWSDSPQQWSALAPAETITNATASAPAPATACASHSAPATSTASASAPPTTLPVPAPASVKAPNWQRHASEWDGTDGSGGRRSGDSQGGSGGGGRGGGGNVKPARTVRCRWRVLLRDCVDAAPAVVASAAAVAGNPAGVPAPKAHFPLRSIFSHVNVGTEFVSEHSKVRRDVQHFGHNIGDDQRDDISSLVVESSVVQPSTSVYSSLPTPKMTFVLPVLQRCGGCLLAHMEVGWRASMVSQGPPCGHQTCQADVMQALLSATTSSAMTTTHQPCPDAGLCVQ